MAAPPVSLVLGNQLLALDPDYPAAQRFKVRQHTVDAVVEVLRVIGPPHALWMGHVPERIRTALDVFAGYVMLDAWIANQDRHHENWAALFDGKVIRLAPTFDHGAALGRNLTDRERADRLTTRDRNRTIAAFSKAARSGFYRSPTDPRPLGTIEAFEAFGQVVPQARSVWLGRLGEVRQESICGILERVPTERMSDTCRRFTLELLLTNQQRLLGKDPR